MTTNSERGFTVIEVMLFLAITGGLFALLIVGVNTNITQQRYLDSVRSYKSMLQSQYAAALATNNEKVDDWKCTTNSAGDHVVAQSGTGTRDDRGSSKCVILGRAIQISSIDETGADQHIAQYVRTSSVTGYDPTGQDTNGNNIDDGNEVESSDDTAAILLYHPQLASFDNQTTQLDWDTNLTTAMAGRQNQASTATILILRSPATGVLKVYATDAAVATNAGIASIVTLAHTSSGGSTVKLSNCMVGNSGLLPKEIVTINTAIAAANGVSTSTDASSTRICS